MRSNIQPLIHANAPAVATTPTHTPQHGESHTPHQHKLYPSMPTIGSQHQTQGRCLAPPLALLRTPNGLQHTVTCCIGAPALVSAALPAVMLQGGRQPCQLQAWGATNTWGLAATHAGPPKAAVGSTPPALLAHLVHRIVLHSRGSVLLPGVSMCNLRSHAPLHHRCPGHLHAHVHKAECCGTCHAASVAAAG